MFNISLKISGQVCIIFLAGVTSEPRVQEDHLSFHSLGCYGMRMESNQVHKVVRLYTQLLKIIDILIHG